MYIFYQSKKKWSLCYIVPVFEKIYSRKNDTPCFEMNISNLMCTVLVYFNAILCSQSPNNLVISVYRVQKNDLTWEIHLYIYIYVLQVVSYNVWNSFESTYRIFGGGVFSCGRKFVKMCGIFNLGQSFFAILEVFKRK